MPDYTYLIIGSGMTGDAALHGIREVDRAGSIGVIGSEAHPPYNRPPLSKALWKGKPLDSVFRKDDEKGVTFHLGRMARKLDLQTKRVTDDQGGLLFTRRSRPRSTVVECLGSGGRREAVDRGARAFYGGGP